MNKVKLFCCDIDGTLTDGTVYYSVNGEELKQFSHIDGRGFHLLRHDYNIKCALITSETGGINKARFEKFNSLGTVQYFADSKANNGKVDAIKAIQKELNIRKEEIAFMGDDTNDTEALEYCGFRACPGSANYKVKEINNIYVCKNNGGNGAVREFIDFLIRMEFVYENKNNI